MYNLFQEKMLNVLTDVFGYFRKFIAATLRDAINNISKYNASERHIF